MSVRQLENTFILTCTLAAVLPANSKTSMTIQIDPVIAGAAQLVVPVNEAWLLEDIFVSAAQTNDGIIEFKKNLTQSAYRSPPVNGLIVTNTARPIPSPIMYEGASMITAEFTNLAVVGGAPVTITVYVKMRRFTPY